MSFVFQQLGFDWLSNGLHNSEINWCRGNLRIWQISASKPSLPFYEVSRHFPGNFSILFLLLISCRCFRSSWAIFIDCVWQLSDFDRSFKAVVTFFFLFFMITRVLECWVTCGWILTTSNDFKTKWFEHFNRVFLPLRIFTFQIHYVLIFHDNIQSAYISHSSHRFFLDTFQQLFLWFLSIHQPDFIIHFLNGPNLTTNSSDFFFFQYFSISDMNECQWQWISGNLPREFSQFWIHPWKDKNWMRTLFFAVSHRRVQHVTEPRQAGLTNHQCRLHRLAGVSIYNNKSKIKSWKRKSKLKLSTAQYNNTTL